MELCSGCHADKDFQNVMGFTGARAEVVDTYKETIHYRILQMGGQDTADCTNCHAGNTIHSILPASIRNPPSILKTGTAPVRRKAATPAQVP